jgi:membrane protease YdiL (CAAX protease family)
MTRRWLWLQLAIGYGILEIALWTSGRSQLVASCAVAAWIVLAILLQGRSAKELGIGTSAFWRALIAVPLAAGVGVGLVLLAWSAGTLSELHGKDPVWLHALSYSIWALFQQFMLQSFFYLNLEALLRNADKAAWVTAVLFGVAHVPNPVLAPATFLAGLALVKLFQRARNIYPLGIAHALLGLAIAISAPHALIRNMRVGASYFHYQSSPRQAFTCRFYPVHLG